MGAMTFNERAAGLTNKVILLAMLPAGLAYIAYDYYGDGGRAVAAALTLYVMIGACRFFWDLRGYLWFWAVMLLIGTIHAALVVEIPWSNGPYPVPILVILFPATMLDFMTIYLVIRSVEAILTQIDR